MLQETNEAMPIDLRTQKHTTDTTNWYFVRYNTHVLGLLGYVAVQIWPIQRHSNYHSVKETVNKSSSSGNVLWAIKRRTSS